MNEIDRCLIFVMVRVRTDSIYSCLYTTDSSEAPWRIVERTPLPLWMDKLNNKSKSVILSDSQISKEGDGLGLRTIVQMTGHKLR